MHPIIRTACVLLLAAPATALAQATKLPFTISEATTKITSPLQKDGTVDYAAALNSKYSAGIKPENNVFVQLLTVFGTQIIDAEDRASVLKMSGAAELPVNASVWTEFEKYLKTTKKLNDEDASSTSIDMDRALNKLWKADDYPELAEYIRAQEKFITLAAKAAELEHYWLPLPASRIPGLPLPPDIVPMGQLVNTLGVRATLRSASGDFKGAAEDIITMRRLARHQAASPIAMSRRAGSSRDLNACLALVTITMNGTLTEQDCNSFLATLERMPPLPPFAEAVDVFERWNVLHAFSCIAVGDVSWVVPRRVDIIKSIDRSMDWDAALKLVNKEFDTQVAAMKSRNFQEARKVFDAFKKQRAQWRAEFQDNGLTLNPGENPAAYSQRVAQGLMSTLITSYGTDDEGIRKVDMQFQMAAALLTAAKIKAKSGKWPADSKAFAEILGGRLPTDMYSLDGTSALKYILRPDGPFIYSVGENGKDDQGDVSSDDVGFGAL